MEFHELTDKDQPLLNAKEFKDLNHLMTQGFALRDELAKHNTIERITKLVKKYLRLVNKERSMIEDVIERSMKVKTSLSVKVNHLITNAHELIFLIKRLGLAERVVKEYQKRLPKFLAKYGLKLKLDFGVKYWSGKSQLMGHKLTLGFNDLEPSRILNLILEMYESSIKTGFLSSHDVLIKGGIMNNLIIGFNREELRLAVNELPSHADFFLKAYVVIDKQISVLKNLVKVMNEKIVSTETGLNRKVEDLSKSVINVSEQLSSALKLLKSARDKGVSAERLISIYNESEFLKDPELMVMSYLRYKYEITDLLDQIAYEYLAANGEVPIRLSDYVSFNKRSPYLFLKTFFAALSN